MQNKQDFASLEAKNGYSLVYFYFLAGITILIATFLFLPKVAMG